MLYKKTKVIFYLFTIIMLFCCCFSFSYAAVERTLTDSGKAYNPPRQYADINFEKELGIENSSLTDLGKIIDNGYKYCDASLLTKGAVILGYQEKQWNTGSRFISADEILKRAWEIAGYRKDREALKSIIGAYNEQSLSVFNPDKAEEIREFSEKIDNNSNNNSNKGTVIVYNNTGKNNLLIYMDDIYIGQAPRNGILRFHNISAGRITLSANDGESLQWGPRKIFLGRDNIFHWKLY